jgi:hypothetical protein
MRSRVSPIRKSSPLSMIRIAKMMIKTFISVSVQLPQNAGADIIEIFTFVLDSE